MRINELLVESQQLDEGPFTQAIGKVGGKIAKGVANIGKDLKTGFKAGYSGEQPPADAAATTAPAAAAAPTQAAPVQKAAPAATTAPAADPAAEKAAKIGVGQINKIIPTLRTRDLMSLQANLEKTIASKKKTVPVAQPTDAASTADPAAETPAPNDPGAAAFGQMANTLTKDPGAANTMANANVSKTNVAKPENPNATAATPTNPADAASASNTKLTKAQQDAKKAELQGKRAAGKTAGTAASGFGDYVKAASSEKIVGANADGSPKIKKINASVSRTGASLSETLARKVQEQKQRMFETALMNGTQSVFKK